MRHRIRLSSDLVALCLLGIASGPAGAESFGSPPPNLLFQLQKQNHGRPWLRVTTDASPLTLRAERIDASGLGGISTRKSDPPAPERLHWNSIARIDEITTQAHTGKVVGFLVGGTIGAWLGTAQFNGGTGFVVGLAVLGTLGAWEGRRVGERRVTGERSWYVATPAQASPVKVDTTTAVAPLIASAVIEDSLAAAALTPSPSVVRACASIGRDDHFRMSGDFGRFEGFASVVAPQGVEGLRGKWDHGNASPASVTTARVTWDRIDAVDKHGRGWRKGALVGGITLGVYGGVAGYVFATDWENGPAETAGLTVYGAVLGGAIGAVLGAGVGYLFPAWLHVYVRPETGGARQ